MNSLIMCMKKTVNVRQLIISNSLSILWTILVDELSLVAGADIRV